MAKVLKFLKVKNFLAKIKSYSHILAHQSIIQKAGHCQSTITFSVRNQSKKRR